MKFVEKYIMEINIINQEGEVVNNFCPNPAIWQTPLSHWNISLLQRYYLANQRQGTKKTKNKGEVSGGGKKPWRQKGTGRARQGSIRAPQWRGGGVVFGPHGVENHSLGINKKLKKNVLQSLLVEKMREKKIIILDKIILSNPKTQEAKNLLLTIFSSYLSISEKLGKIIIILAEKEEKKSEIARAFRNLSYISIIDSKLLNASQVLSPNYLIFTHPAIVEIEKRLSQKNV
jgi:large subunit ribosomal protein L4